MKDRFEFDLTVWKADQRDGKPCLLIYATDTADDRHGDNCTLACLEGLQKQIRDGGIEILNSHHDAVGLGQAVDAHIVDAEQFDFRLKGERALLVDTILDPHDPRAIKLFEKAQQSTPENPLIRFSIGGELNKANPRRVLWKTGGGRQLNDMVLDHITACRPLKASNTRTHIAEAVFKTLEYPESDPGSVVLADNVAADKDKTMPPDSFVAALRKLAFGDGVEKALSTAYFEGESGPAGKGENEHVHQFTARLNADGGTVIGMTQNWSAGDRHSHMIDLMGDDDPVTSGPSRGFQHFHALEMPTVRQLTQAEYEKTVAALVAEDPNATVLQVDPADLEKLAPAVEPAPVDVAAKKAEDDEEPDEDEPETKAAMGFFKTMIQKLRHKEPPTPLVLLKQTASYLTPEAVAKDGFDAVVGGTIEVLRKVLAAAPADRESLTVRAAKTISVLEAAATGTELPKEAVGALVDAFAKHTNSAPDGPTAPPAEASGGGKSEVLEGEAGEKAKEEMPAGGFAGAENATKPAPVGGGEEDEGVPDMKREELLAALKEFAAEQTVAIVKGVTDAFRKDGLLPAKDNQTETPASGATSKEAPPATETPVSKEAAPAAPAQAETLTAPADAQKDGGEVEALRATLDTVLKTVDGLNATVQRLSNAPAAPRNIAGQDGPATPPQAKRGVFSGALFRGDKPSAKA